MATSDDVDALISRLSGPLLPPARIAFRAAALDALARIPCLGEGAIYRAVASLQRHSKLASAPAIGADDPRCGGRDRHRLRAV